MKTQQMTGREGVPFRVKVKFGAHDSTEEGVRFGAESESVCPNPTEKGSDSAKLIASFVNYSNASRLRCSAHMQVRCIYRG
jgi:hypothetical protein